MTSGVLPLARALAPTSSRRKIVLTYMALVIRLIVGKFHSIKGDDLTHPGFARARGVRVDVESGSDARVVCVPSYHPL